MNLTRHRTIVALACVAAAASQLQGCSNVKETFGLAQSPPDEFAVVTRAPLSVPPDIHARPDLPQPRPGAQRPQEKPVQDEAKDILINTSAPRSAGNAPSQGEMVLLGQAGARDVDSSIRDQVNRESQVLANNQYDFIDRLIFWQKKEPAGELVDAEKELKRIRENDSLGKSVTEGELPTIERRKKGWFEGIFN